MAKLSSEYYEAQVGAKYGLLTILSIAEGRHYRAACCCECGNLTTVNLTSLVSGNTRSCGCLRVVCGGGGLKRFSTKHGLTGTKEHRVWMGVINRCTAPNSTGYPDYGGRGITVSKDWQGTQGFLQFLGDMGHCPQGYTIERVDVNGDYCKENCIWDTLSEQNFNRRQLGNNTTGRTGVHFNKRAGKYHVSIMHQGVKTNAGYFVLFDEAVSAREQLELKLFGFIKED